VLVSLDGFRWDYQDRYATPALDRLAAAGIRADRLTPVFPTLTFPTHYSIATGLHPGSHGIVANSFVDPESGRRFSLRDREAVEDGSWYGGEPIWVTAETQGMVTAAYFFVGTEADVKGVRPTHWRTFSYDDPPVDRVGQVLEWLSEPRESRPHLATLYFEDVDRAAHDFGPDSPEAAEAVERVDSYLALLLDGIDDLPHGASVYVVVVSDHGLGTFEPEAEWFFVDEILDLEGVTVVGGGPYMYLHLPEGYPLTPTQVADRVDNAWERGMAWAANRAPGEWHIRGNPRFGDVILLADAGYGVSTSDRQEWVAPAGAHGWAPEVPEMGGVFLASGPGLPRGVRIGEVGAVDVYPLMARALGLRPAAGLDGDPAVLADMVGSGSGAGTDSR
jgi:predicted AlkP superfamily pyrophosphatase or phosphodiesterase